MSLVDWDAYGEVKGTTLLVAMEQNVEFGGHLGNVSPLPAAWNNSTFLSAASQSAHPINSPHYNIIIPPTRYNSPHTLI